MRYEGGKPIKLGKVGGSVGLEEVEGLIKLKIVLLLTALLWFMYFSNGPSYFYFISMSPAFRCGNTLEIYSKIHDISNNNPLSTIFGQHFLESACLVNATQNFVLGRDVKAVCILSRTAGGSRIGSGWLDTLQCVGRLLAASKCWWKAFLSHNKNYQRGSRRRWRQSHTQSDRQTGRQACRQSNCVLVCCVNNPHLLTRSV